MRIKRIFPVLMLIGLTTECIADDCNKAREELAKGVALADGSAKEEEIYRECLKICPGLAEAHYNLGVLLTKTGRNQEAITEYQEAIKLRHDAQYAIALGIAELGQSHHEEARQSFENALTIDQKSVKALQGLSVAYSGLGRTDEAISTLQRARALDDDNITTLYNLAALLVRSGKGSDAIPVLEKVVEIDEYNFDALLLLGLEYQRQDDFEKSARVLKRAAGVRTESVETLRALGLAQERLGDLDKAELSFRKALNIDGNDTATYINLAVVLINKKQEGLAEEVAEKARALEPQNSRALSVLGWSQMELGKYDQAESALKRALELDNTNTTARNNLRVVLERQGKKDEAAKLVSELTATH